MDYWWRGNCQCCMSYPPTAHHPHQPWLWSASSGHEALVVVEGKRPSDVRVAQCRLTTDYKGTFLPVSAACMRPCGVYGLFSESITVTHMSIKSIPSSKLCLLSCTHTVFRVQQGRWCRDILSVSVTTAGDAWTEIIISMMGAGLQLFSGLTIAHIVIEVPPFSSGTPWPMTVHAWG